MPAKRRESSETSTTRPSSLSISSLDLDHHGGERGTGMQQDESSGGDDDDARGHAQQRSSMRRDVRDARALEEDLNRSMAVDVGLRKEQKQQRLEHEFEDKVRDLQTQIDQRFDEHQRESKTTQDAQLGRLLALAERKADVEAQILQHVRDLADAYEVAKEELEAVLRGRAEDVKAAIAALTAVQEMAAVADGS